MIPQRYQNEYKQQLSKLFYFRINLFCYIAICAFLIELILGLSVFKRILTIKDMPGVIGGIILSILLLSTAKISQSLYFQKVRAFVFTFILILIAVLAAVAHPRLVLFMGITLVLLAFFPSVLLLPWTLFEVIIIGLFTLISYIWISLATGTYIANEILGINIGLLTIAIFIGAVVERSEQILRKKSFLSRKEIEEKNAIMAQELTLARKIHKSLMPHSMQSELADIAAIYKPMFYMGGDYAKFHFIDNNKLMFIVADVTGHGVSSALLVNRVHTEVERLIRENLEPGQILKSLDEFINKDFGKMGFYLSAFCGLLDFSKNELIYSNYGHPPQILLQTRDNKIALMESQTFLMGIGMDIREVYNTTIAFERGDRLILFTDGIIEAKNTNEDMFGHKRLENFAKNNINLDVREFNNSLIDEIDSFQSGKQSDDIFVLTIQTK